MKKYGNVEDHSAFPVALVVRGSDLIACDVVVVNDFAVVGDGSIKWAVLTVANATYYCIVVVHSHLTGRRSHLAGLLEILDYFCFSIIVLVEKFGDSVLTLKYVKLVIK